MISSILFALSLAVTVPETNTAAMPETNTAAMPETNTAAMPETNTAAMPETNTAAMPDANAAAAMPETNTAAMPETNTAAMPDANAAAAMSDDTVVVDSRQTLQQALAGTAASDSITEKLTLVDVEYYSFDNKLHRGQIVVHKELKDDIAGIFREIKRTRFPVRSVIPIKFDRPDNGTSMDTLNNTYGFHYRPIVTVKTTKLSAHSTGRAIDINPYHNPAILKNGTIIPKGACYDTARSGTLTALSPLTRLFRQYGWHWGGSWVSLKDYMHFEKP